MSWFENLGVGNGFSTKNTFAGSNSSGSLISDISTADVDLDGDLDVLTANMGSNRVSWHENLGSGTFSSRHDVATSEDATSVWASDLDGDGDPDILSASWLESRIAWYANGIRTQSSLSLVFCDTTSSYTVPSGLNTYNTSGTYYDTIPNTNGGDSIITISLRFNAVDSVAFSSTICAGDTLSVGVSQYTIAGFYVDSLFNIYGCDSVLYTQLDVRNVYSSTTVNGRSISADSALAGYTYQWINCSTGLAVPNATDTSFSPVTSGDYALVVNFNGCTDTSACKTVINDIGLEESAFYQLSVHPNPTKDDVRISFERTLPDATVYVRDVFGKLCYTAEYNQTKEIELSLADYASGLFFIEVSTEWGKQVRRVVKE
jgi:hypothetical protein